MPADAPASPRPRDDPELDDAYHEYLWGEASPRSFARKSRFVRARNDGSRRILKVVADPDVGLGVSR